MVHLFAMSQLVHHDHDNVAEWQPATCACTQHQLDHFACVEVPTHELNVCREFLQRHYREVIRPHHWNTDCRNAGKYVFCQRMGWPIQRFNEDDSVVWRLDACAEAFNAE